MHLADNWRETMKEAGRAGCGPQVIPRTWEIQLEAGREADFTRECCFYNNYVE